MGWAGEGVFDGGVFGQQLGGQVRVGDVPVVRRERVAAQTEGTDPELAADVDLAASPFTRCTQQKAGPIKERTSKGSRPHGMGVYMLLARTESPGGLRVA